MSALRGIGAAFEGFTRGVKLADEMETSEQNRKIRLAAEEREATRFAEEQRVREQRQLLNDALSRMDGISSMDQLEALRSEVAAGPKKKAKGVSAPPTTAAPEQPAAAGIAPPAPAAPDQPPATGIPSPAQTFAYGTNPATPLTISPEGAAPAEPAPAAQAPAAPEGGPQQPAPRMIASYGSNKELREQIYKTSGDFYRRLALLEGKTELAIRIPEITQKALDAEYDRTIGRTAIEARLGNVGSLRKLIENYGPELGFEGFKVPVGAAQSKDGSWEILNANGEPTRISVDMLDYVAQRSQSAPALLKTLYERADKKIEQDRLDKELAVKKTESEARLKLAEANQADVRERRTAREKAEAERLATRNLQAAKQSATGILGFKQVSPERYKDLSPADKRNYEAASITHGMAQQIIDMSIDPDEPVDRRIAPAAADVARTITAPNSIAIALTGSEQIPKDWKPSNDGEKALKARYDQAVAARVSLSREIQRDDRGFFIVRNGIRIAMPAPQERQEPPPAAAKPAASKGATEPPPSIDRSSGAFRAGQAVRSGAEVAGQALSTGYGLATLPSNLVRQKIIGGATDVIEGAAEFAYGVRTPQ